MTLEQKFFFALYILFIYTVPKFRFLMCLFVILNNSKFRNFFFNRKERIINRNVFEVQKKKRIIFREIFFFFFSNTIELYSLYRLYSQGEFPVCVARSNWHWAFFSAKWLSRWKIFQTVLVHFKFVLSEKTEWKFEFISSKILIIICTIKACDIILIRYFIILMSVWQLIVSFQPMHYFCNKCFITS